MARRKSHIVKRLSKMRGLPPPEKQLLMRIGELVDGVINNRTPTNPFQRGRTRVDPKLPPPRIVTNEPGIKSAKLSWPAIDSSILDHYKITIINKDFGVDEEFISYTNSFIFKGREGGNYKALIQSVGRNGTQSMPSVIDFFVPEDVMLLEGAKNGVSTISNVVSEDFYLSKGHVIFVWGSFTIDKLIGGSLVGNPDAALRLYRGEQDETIENATLIQEVPLFAATESATNLDGTALGGISRPALSGSAAEDINYVRGTTFETCHSVMFSPFTVTDELADKAHTFFLEVIGRDTPDDIASLSIVLWGANAGEADQIPSDPFTLEPAIVEEWEKAIEVNTTNASTTTEWLHGTVSNNFNFIGSQYTFGIWVKWRRMGYDIGQFATLVDRWQPISISPFGAVVNGLRILVGRFTGILPGDNYVETQIRIGDRRNGSTGDPEHQGNWIARDSTSGAPAASNPDANPPYGVVGTSIWGNLNGWVLFFCTFNPTDGLRVFSFHADKTTVEETPVTNDTNSGLIIPVTDGPRAMVFFGDGAALYADIPGNILDGPTDVAIRPSNCRCYSAGMWNKNLTVAEMTELYNNGAGSEVNWRSNTGDYKSAGSLLHYWQFAAIFDELQYVGRDTGINPLGSGGNDGDIDTTVTGDNPPTTQTFSTGFTLDDIVDDFPA